MFKYSNGCDLMMVTSISGMGSYKTYLHLKIYFNQF